MADTRSVAALEAAGVLRVEDGNHGEYRPRPHEFVAGGTPYIRAADMTSGTVDFTGAEGINDEALLRIRKGIGREQDSLLSHKGTVGKVAYVPPGSPPFVCSPQTTFWRSLDHQKLDPVYLNIALRSRVIQAQLDVMKSSTDMAPYVSLTQQRSLMLNVPPIGEQRAIAEVLGALDDKIAANMRVVDIAGHLSDALFGAVVGTVPFGDLTFGSLGGVFGGGTPSSKTPEYWNGDIPWAAPTDITKLSGPYLFDTGRKITAAGLANCASRLYPAGSILMTSRATIGAFALAQIPVAVNQGFIVVVPQSRALGTWLFHEMRSRVEEFLTHANGATFLELSRGNFKRLPVRLPSDEALEHFDTQVRPLHEAAAAAMRENGRLAATRDALLPALMSGALRVKDAERLAEDLT